MRLMSQTAVTSKITDYVSLNTMVLVITGRVLLVDTYIQ